jgi:hypothetical protein
MRRCASRLVLALGLCQGCSLDWTIGTGHGGSAGSGGSGGSAGSADSGDDGTTPAADAADARHETAASCNALEANVDSTRAAARLCASTPTACKSKVTDQCGCTVFVAESSSAATTAYAQAISALEASGCPRGCGTCSNPATSECLVGPGLKDVCTP